MEVAYGEELGVLFFDPARFGQGLALGAVTVTAGIIGRVLKAAGVTLLEVAT